MITYLYIACRGHSGSTLLEKLLATAPAVAALGEACHFSHYFDDAANACGCGASVRDCPFWSQVVARLGISRDERVNDRFPTDGYRTGIAALDLAYHVGLVAPSPLLDALSRVPGTTAWENAQRTQNHWRVVDQVVALSDATVLVDKSMSASRAIELSLTAPARYRICVIHLIRDGRANAHSHRELFGVPFDRGVRSWRKDNLNIERALHRLRDVPRVTLRYETLCAEPSAVLQRIATKFGFEAGDFSLDRLGALNHAIGGNYAKLSGYSQIGQDQRWQTALSLDEFARFERIAGPLNRRYGDTG